MPTKPFALLLHKMCWSALLIVTLPKFWSRNVSPDFRLAGMIKSSINCPVFRFKVELKFSVDPFGNLEVMLNDYVGALNVCYFHSSPVNVVSFDGECQW